MTGFRPWATTQEERSEALGPAQVVLTDGQRIDADPPEVHHYPADGVGVDRNGSSQCAAEHGRMFGSCRERARAAGVA
jgi:hypothetical protein